MQNNEQRYSPPSTPYLGSPQAVQPNYPMSYRGAQVIHINRNAAIGLGISQMVIGVMCFIMNVVLLGINEGLLSPSFVGYGIWGGVLFFVAGLLQVLSATQEENRCFIVGAMVMSIISACDCAIVFALGIVEANNGNLMRNAYKANVLNYSTKSPSYEFGNVHFAIGIVMVILAVIEASLAIASSSLYCGDVCCKYLNATYPTRVVVNQPVAYHSNNSGAAY